MPRRFSTAAGRSRPGRPTRLPRASSRARTTGSTPIADLVPEDLALGWGPMSDNTVLTHFEISQGVRFYEWRPRDALPVARETVISHSANTHVIPANQSVRKELAALRVGQVVHLTGDLVDAKRDDGAWMTTSLTRLDSGAGACEVLLVESVEVR